MRITPQPTFRVPTDSKAHLALTKDNEARARAEDAWAEFCNKYGGDRLYSGTSLEGITFDNGKTPPEHWVRCKDCGIAYRPSLKGPLSEAAKEFKSLPSKPNNVELLQSLGLDIHPLGGRYLTPGYLKRNGTWYIVADPGCPIPDEVVEVFGEERDQVHAREDSSNE